MAISYLDEYQALDAQPYQKAKLYQYLNDNIGQLDMTPDESYRFNWGADALSTDWLTKKAADIQKNVEQSNSEKILRRSLETKKEEEKKDDTEEKTDSTDTKKASLLEVNGSGGDGPTSSKSQSTGAFSESTIDALGKAAGIAETMSSAPSVLGQAIGRIGGYGIGVARDQMIDSISNQFNAVNAAHPDGVSTRTNADGSVSTVSTQAAIDSFDQATFGTTSAEMDAARGSDFGGLSANDGPGAADSSHDADGNDGWN